MLISMLTKVLSLISVFGFIYLIRSADMVHILDAKVTRRYGEYFIRNINKFEEIIRDVSGR